MVGLSPLRMPWGTPAAYPAGVHPACGEQPHHDGSTQVPPSREGAPQAPGGWQIGIPGWGSQTLGSPKSQQGHPHPGMPICLERSVNGVRWAGRSRSEAQQRSVPDSVDTPLFFNISPVVMYSIVRAPRYARY